MALLTAEEFSSSGLLSTALNEGYDNYDKDRWCRLNGKQMKYAELVDYYQRLEATQSKLEMADILSQLFGQAGDEINCLAILAMGSPFPAWKDLEIGISSKLMLKALAQATGASQSELNEKWKETGDLGDVAVYFIKNKRQETLMQKELTVQGFVESLESIASLQGSGSQDNKIANIAELIGSASPREGKYVVRTILGELRIGVGEGIVRDALAQAFDIDKSVIEQAYELTNDYGVVARTAKEEGAQGLKKLEIELFKPIKVMLAQKVDSMEEGFETVADADGRCALDFKYDGMRSQIHIKGDKVKIFTRRLEDVTDQFPDVRQAVKSLIEAEECIIDAEIVAYDPEDGSLIPFQKLSRRIKRKYEIERMVKEIPVVLHPFDLIYYQGRSLIDQPYRDRWQQLTEIVATSEVKKDQPRQDVELASHLVTDSTEEARTFYQRALNKNQEGVMLKNLEANYKPGSRVGYMVKLKPHLEDLDLAIVGAEWGEGRRSDWLASFTLACRDEESGGYQTVGKMGTGLTDEQFAEMTQRLQDLITNESGRQVEVRPEVVIEVAYEEIQKSPTYESGYALRFPRLYRIRDDLGPQEADSLTRVKKIYKDQG